MNAAKAFGCSGAGYDLDATLIEKAVALAEAEGVTHLVHFEARDIVEVDWTKASVIVVYLLPGPLRKIRDRLADCVRGGARVVSVQWEVPELKDYSGISMQKHTVKNTSFFYLYEKK